jgi:hypothetical protein
MTQLKVTRDCKPDSAYIFKNNIKYFFNTVLNWLDEKCTN